MDTEKEADSGRGGPNDNDVDSHTSSAEAAPSMTEEDLFDEGPQGDHEENDGTASQPETNAIVTEVSLGLQPEPCGDDGQVYLLGLSQNVMIEAERFSLHHFKMPNANLAASSMRTSETSAANMSRRTIRWREGVKGSRPLQSNAKVNRWSDGSMTLQIASDPDRQFELSAKYLTTRLGDSSKNSRNPDIPISTDPTRTEEYTYLVAPHEGAQIMRHSRHISTSLAVQSIQQLDVALNNLKQGLAAASKGQRGVRDKRIGMISINEDPENAKKRAELAEKEKVKAQKRLQLQQERENRRAQEVLRRSGLNTSSENTGLTIGDLEGSSRKSQSRPRKLRSRNIDSDDEDDELSNAYDEEDDFVAKSDEDMEAADSPGTDGEEPTQDSQRVRPSNDALHVRNKKRRIVDEDDDAIATNEDNIIVERDTRAEVERNGNG